MKKVCMLLVCICMAALVGCNNNNNDQNVDKNPTSTNQNGNAANNGNGTTTNNQTNQTGTATQNMPFTSFDLDVDYSNFKSFEVDYENEDDGLSVKVEDEINNRTLRGDEALQELQNKFQHYTFDKNTDTDTVIKEVLDSFDLKNDFKKFDLEITYSDGTEKEYQLQK
ncbi:YusW family protein [Bacillus testis]|uniref:YusW family protein n=1 Tax=Bacillus testis TaxID=1622072 RepID=UPI00067EA590|nr:YusW family protein [Bacillus testis]